MIIRILALTVPVLFLGVAQAHAASCSSFGVIKSFDADASTVVIGFTKGKEHKFFPKPDGTPRISKIPDKCRSKVLKQDSYPVKAIGGKLTVTQVRENFSSKMLNDTEDSKWLPAKLKELIDGKTEVVVALRPPVGEKKPYGVTTIYLPAGPVDLAEIKRLNEQAQDVE